MQSRPDIHSLKIKMKHEKLIAHFKHYISLNKHPWKELSDTGKIDFIENAFSRDLSFRNEVRGVVIGQFTLEEYAQYAKIMHGSNKRMNNIIKERMMSHLDVLSL